MITSVKTQIVLKNRTLACFLGQFGRARHFLWCHAERAAVYLVVGLDYYRVLNLINCTQVLLTQYPEFVSVHLYWSVVCWVALN